MQQKDLTFSTRHFGTTRVVTGEYQRGGRIAVELVDEKGESITMLSVNMPDESHLLGEGEFFAKTWSENVELAEDALASGLFRDTGRRGGFVNASIWTFK